MFSFFRWIYRRLFIFILLCYCNIVEFVSSIDDKRIFHETQPFRNNDDLRQYVKNPYSVTYLIHPLTTRCTARKFGDHYLNLEQLEQNGVKELNETLRPKVLVCHDMAGNYRDDRFVSGSKKYDDYRFYHWSGVDIFNYFSHNYITIPTIPWINAAHRHGVPVLGTFITEGSDGIRNLDGVLKSEETVREIVDGLVLTTKNFGFDGWLINIESSVATDQIVMLKFFVKLLTYKMHDAIPHSKVIWYDSVVESGSVSWQNEVNERNIEMYKGSDGILLNYWWNDNSLQQTAKILNQDKFAMQQVFVGIDVFGRSQTAKFHTHETLKKIKDYNFSVGIFAPGWTFENIGQGIDPWTENGTDQCNYQFLARNNRFWNMLWKYLYSRGPNSLPFYTSFCMGSGKRRYRDGLLLGNKPWFNLMEQEYQPSVPSLFEYHFEEAYRGGSCLRFIETIQNARLFVTEFECKNDIVVSYVYKRNDPSINIAIILNVENGTGDKNILVYCNSDGNVVHDTNVQRPCEQSLKPVTGYGLRILLRGLSHRDEKTFPSISAPVNGWETRYFYLKFDETPKSIVDVGISVTMSKESALLLGGLHVHKGIENSERVHQSPRISFKAWQEHKHTTMNEIAS